MEAEDQDREDRRQAAAGGVMTLHAGRPGGADGSGAVYYHVTPSSNLERIQRDGLHPTTGARSAQLDERPSTFLFTSRIAAEDAVMNWLGDQFDEDTKLVLLRVQLPKSIPVTVTPGAEFEVSVGVYISGEYVHPVSMDLGSEADTTDGAGSVASHQLRLHHLVRRHQREPQAACSMCRDDLELRETLRSTGVSSWRM